MLFSLLASFSSGLRFNSGTNSCQRKISIPTEYKNLNISVENYLIGTLFKFSPWNGRSGRSAPTSTMWDGYRWARKPRTAIWKRWRPTGNGRYLSHVAIYDIEVTKWLAQEVDADIDLKDNDGKTVLDLAMAAVDSKDSAKWPWETEE